MSARSLLALGLLAIPSVVAAPDYSALTEKKSIFEPKTVISWVHKTVFTCPSTFSFIPAPSSHSSSTSALSSQSISTSILPSQSPSASSLSLASSSAPILSSQSPSTSSSSLQSSSVSVSSSQSLSVPASSSQLSSASTIASSSASATSVSVVSVSSTSTTSSGINTDGTTTVTATATGTVGLNDYAKATGKLYFGTANDIPGTHETTDQYYLAELGNTHDFGQSTPGNALKWVNTEQEQGVFNYTQADEALAVAAANGQLVRCHNLNWYNQLPNWLTSGTWTNETLTAVLQNHIDNLVTYFGDKCYSWDVVNEALNDTSSGNLDDQYTWRQDMWYEIMGPSFVNVAFAAAEAAVKRNNLNVKLYYNDYNIESPNGKTTAALALVKSVKDAGIQIDGAGLQSHFIVGSTPSTASQVETMNAFVALGVEVAITELDIRTTLPPTDAAQLQQVQDYKTTVQACVEVDGCIGITVWDFDDTYSWIPSTFAGQGYGDLFFQPGGQDTPLVRKAAYDGVVAGLTNTTVTV